MAYVFDGSYAGFLTCIFECFERKEYDAAIVSAAYYQPTFFQIDKIITTDIPKAKRVEEGLAKKVSHTAPKDFFCNFLSEDPEAWSAAFRIVIKLFLGATTLLQNYGDADVLYFTQTLKKVSRERHRMKAFVRFQKCNDGMYTALVEPDFNVLPLIAEFFKKRYADQPWLIYDVKRKYGLLYDKERVTEVLLSAEEKPSLDSPIRSITLDDRDELFQRLWLQYFKSTNIEARRNLKLHLQHVPKRYWKHLAEKK